ncbi:hypothetical protein B0H14DRAFT_3879389 [Mycena olivaceomarginata]|nr:hypothetical protein B0H14DRAFT_3879389 [Mycena olivaceomarginata]
MQFTFAILAAFVSAAVAAPATKRQNSCPLQNLGGLSVTASADSSGKTRWDVFTVSSGLIQQGDLAWFNNDQPNGNEVFTAAVGSQPNLFTFQRKGAQPIGVDGTTLLASDSAATFKVSCGGCNAFASGNDLCCRRVHFRVYRWHQRCRPMHHLRGCQLRGCSSSSARRGTPVRTSAFSPPSLLNHWGFGRSM